MVSIKRVSYAYNSILEDQGLDAYWLDALVSEDGEMVVDVHKAFKSKDEFMQEILAIVPMLEVGETTDAPTHSTSDILGET